MRTAEVPSASNTRPGNRATCKFSKADPLDIIERYLISMSIVELRGGANGVTCHMLGGVKGIADQAVKIKLDENPPERLVSELQFLRHDVDTVRAEHLAGMDDNNVWQAAQSVNRFLITQDLDFSDIRRFTPGTHAGLLLVRLGQPGQDVLVARVAMLFAKEGVEAWPGCLVVATDR
jgi:predicted nuclease of predicted toxin-antitoxin system